MADFTLVAGPFPAGTTVGVYARRTVIRPTSGPIGAAITTGTTAANRTTAFTGLAYETDYWAAASIGGTWRKVQFTTDVDPTLILLTAEDLLDFKSHLPVNVEDYSGTHTQKWLAAIADAVALTTATSLGVLAAPPGSAYTITEPLDAAARIGLDCRGVRLTTDDKFTALTIGPNAVDVALGIGQRPNVLHPPEVINGTGDITGTTPGLLLRSMYEARVVDAMASGWPVAFDMTGNCLGTVWDNPHARAGLNRVGMRLRGMTSPTEAGAGNDITIRNPWLGGQLAGIWIDPDSGGFHIQHGQVNAGEGIAVANDEAGAICWGKNLDDPADLGIVGSVDLDGVSFEGTQFAWCLRGFGTAVHLSSYKSIARSNIANRPIIGIIKTGSTAGTIDFRRTEAYGAFSSAALASVTFVQAIDFWDESGTAMSGTVGTNADGSGGVAIPLGSIAQQSAITSGVVTDRVAAGSRLFVNGEQHSAVVKESATIADDAVHVFSARSVSNLALYWLIPNGAMALRHGHFVAEGATVTDIQSGASVVYGNTVLTNGTSDGVDGSLNVYPASATTIGVKNRLGGAVAVALASIGI